MNRLSTDDIIKFAGVSSKFRNLLLGIDKKADNESTEFNENPPVNEKNEEEEKGKPPAKPPVKPEEPAAVPIPEPAPVGQTPEEVGARAAQNFIGPEVMQAAVQGEPAAQDIIARTAGQVAGAVAEAVARTTPQGGGPEVPPEGLPPESAGAVPAEATAVPAGAPAVAPISPEEAIAASVVPEGGQAPVPAQVPTQAPAQAGPGKAPQTQVAPVASPAPAPAQGIPPKPGAKGAPVDAETVAKLIELARAGKI